MEQVGILDQAGKSMSKDLRLLSLSLRNFKGVKRFILDLPNGENVSIYGENATGKTTLFDAFIWLLFDKDSRNRKDFQIKTLDEEGNVALHGGEHEVTATFSCKGRSIVLRKVFTEKWTKQRGSAEKVFTGHTTDYFINDVPKKKAEYDLTVAEMVNEKIFRLLSDPLYFNTQLHWRERRALLLTVCGDVSDEDVINSSEKLQELTAILGDRSLDDHRAMLKAQLTIINKELNAIPIRISEVELGLPEIEGLNAKEINAELKDARAELRTKQRELGRIESGKGIDSKVAKIEELEAERALILKQASWEHNLAVNKMAIEVARVHGEVCTTNTTLEHKQGRLEIYRTTLAEHNHELEELRRAWIEIDTRLFDVELDSDCPTCGQPLPANLRDQIYEDALSKFNKDKSQQLEAIDAKGQVKAQALKRLQQTIEETEDSLQKDTEQVKHLTEKWESLNKQYLEMKAFTAPMSEAEMEIDKQIAELKEKAAELEEAADNEPLLMELRQEIEAVQEQVEEIEGRKALLEQHKAGKKRIAELSADEKKLAKEYETAEREIWLTEEFIRTKVAMLDSKINSRFKLARFKLFDVQINGAISETCETLYKGIPFSSDLNDGARINVGIDIINTLSEHYEYAVPMWVDNAESVVTLTPTDAQTIRLVVSEGDKKLRIERD